MAIMPWSYMFRRAELKDGRPQPVANSHEDILLRIYVCGMCGYSEFYWPHGKRTHLIEVPPETD